MYDYVTTKPDLDDVFIAHYGVKGMKWRRRKASSFSKEVKNMRRGGSHRFDEDDEETNSRIKKAFRKAEYAVVSKGARSLQNRMAKNAKTARVTAHRIEKFDPSGVRYVLDNMGGGSHGFDEGSKKKKKNKNGNH